ncbi:MAG: hypothetical protein K9J74_07135 [Sulfuritalea sp.]|nr:hypothetical protein [Sulfuritalea sp.]
MLKLDQFVVDQLIVPSLVLFFFIGGVAALLISAGLILRSARLFRLFGVMNHSVSTRTLSRPLEIPRNSNDFVWKYSRLIASFFIIGAAYALYRLVAHIDNAAVVAALNLSYRPVAVLWIVESARLLLIVGCIASLVVGALLGFSPAAMRTLEARASRWISTRRMAPDADKMIMSLDNLVAAFPRTAGWVILLPALGMVFYFGRLLLK